MILFISEIKIQSFNRFKIIVFNIINKSLKQTMSKILASYIKIAHVVLITHICTLICDPNPKVSLNVFLLDLGLSLLNIIVGRKHYLDISQVILSLTLTYTFIPNNYTFLSGLYFLKIIFVYNALGEVVEDLFAEVTHSLGRLLKLVLSLLRFTLVEYLFLGLVMLGYKLFTLGDKEGVLPQDYIILYKLIITASTIGYGDVTPKTKLQVHFITFAVPFLCASFTIYFNAVIPIFGELIDYLVGNSSSLQTAAPLPKGFQAAVWTKAERQSFKTFAEQVAKRKAEEDLNNSSFGNNWLAIAANNYESQIPLITQILQGDETKEIKLKVSSKIRKLYYPSEWTILNAGDVSEDLILVDEGQVETPSLQSKGFVFNRDGFVSKTPSRETVVAHGFVGVWAISRKDIEEIISSYPKLQSSLRDGLKDTRH